MGGENSFVPSQIRLMRILFIHNTIPTYWAPFFKLLDQEFDNIRFIFTFLEASAITYGEEPRNTFDRLGLRDAKLCKAYFPQVVPSLLEGIPFALPKYLFTDDFDVIHDNIQSFKIILSLFASVVRRKPLITWTEQWYEFDRTLFGRLKSLILATVLRKSSAVLVPGVKAREFVHKFQIDPAKVFTMPDVSLLELSTAPQKAHEFKESHGIAQKKMILYVGRLIERKGVQHLINAFSVLCEERDDAVLVIVGQGPFMQSLQELANSTAAPKSIFFLGRVGTEELATIYSVSTICVVPSVSHTKRETDGVVLNEPWGFAVNEAMQFGKPVIATEAVGAAYDMITDGKNGFMVPERDEIKLYEKLKILIEDKELRDQMGVESRNLIASHYQYADMIAGFVAALEYVFACNTKRTH